MLLGSGLPAYAQTRSAQLSLLQERPPPRTIFLAVQKPEWTQWVDGGESILNMEKRNGQWSIKPNLWGFPAYEPAPDCGWIQRIGQGRTPSRTIASYDFKKFRLTLTDVNFTLTDTRVLEVPGDTHSDPVVVWFWDPNFEVSIQEENNEEQHGGPETFRRWSTYCIIVSKYHSESFGGNPIWLTCPTDRSVAEKLRQQILDAQAEWRKKYPH